MVPPLESPITVDFRGSIMTEPVLSYPVFTLDNEQLLPAGTRLTPDILKEIASAGNAPGTPHIHMLAHATVADDLREFCRQSPYDVIFSDGEQLDLLFRQMERLRLSRPLIDFLDFFREQDFYTYQHTLTVFALSMLLAHVLEDDAESAVREALGAPTHDFGKLCVPLPVLKKAEPLTAMDRRQLEHHALAGYVLLTYYTGNPLNPAAVAARDHHERKDGSGYPIAKKLNDHMVEIVAVSDIFDALIATRPYRRGAFDTRTALEQITVMGEEGKLSWDIIRALVSCNRRDHPDYAECHISLEKQGTPPQDNLYGVTAD